MTYKENKSEITSTCPLIFFICKEYCPIFHYGTTLISSQKRLIVGLQFMIFFVNTYLGSFILTFDLKTICFQKIWQVVTSLNCVLPWNRQLARPLKSPKMDKPTSLAGPSLNPCAKGSLNLLRYRHHLLLKLRLYILPFRELPFK